MRRTLIALLATAAIAAPALAANAPSQPQQPSNPAQQQSQAQQGQNTQASNQQTISPQSLSRGEIKQMQTALNNDGFKVGRPDGKWGPRTSQAAQKFAQSKGIQSQKGRLNENTLAQLGVNTNQQGNSQQPQQNGGSQNNNH